VRFSIGHLRTWARIEKGISYLDHFVLKSSLVFLIKALLITVQVLHAQGSTKGSIEGIVSDARTGEGLPNVTVLVKGTYYGAATDLDGKYHIVNVNPGEYTLTFSIIGYKTVEYTGVKVKAGEKTSINVKMEETVLSLGQEVVIIGEKPLFDIQETQSRRAVTREDIAISTVENVRDVVTQQVGVVQSDNEVHIRGGRSYENAYIVDGVSVQDPLAGTGFGLQLSANALQEVEVITGGFNAEYGQATSGVVRVTTRDGGPNFEGNISYKRDNLYFNRNSSSNFNTSIYEGWLSGPEPLTHYLLPAIGIRIPGEVFFFGDLYVGLSDGDIYGRARKKANQLFSSTFFGTRFAPNEENNWYAFGKFTWKPTAIFKLSYSYSQSVTINQNSQTLQTNLEYVEPSPGFQYPFENILDNATTFTHNSIVHSLVLTHTLSTKTFYELKLSRFFTSLRADANGRYWYEYREPKDVVTLPPQYYNTNRDTVGIIPGDGLYDTGNSFTWHDHYVKEYTIKFDITSNLSEKQRLKTGFESSFQEMQLADIYKPWIGQLGLNNDIYKVYPAFGAFYIQDNIIFSGMILNAGVRFDYWFPGKYVDDAVNNPAVITIPEELRRSYHDHTYNFFGRRWKGRIAPRLGISHPVSDNQTLFFSYGIFSKRPKPQFVYAKLSPTSAQSTFQTFGNPDLNPETTVAYELGLRNQFTENDVLTVTAYYKDIFDYVSTRQALIKLAGQAGLNFITYVNQDYARTRGIEVEYKKRIGRWFSGTVSGSYSIATGKSSSSAEGLLAIQQGQEQPVGETYLIWDRPLQLSVSGRFFVGPGKGILGFGKGWLDNLNAYFRIFFESGKRYTPQIFAGYAANGKPLYYPDAAHPNGAVGANWFWVDMNIEKYIRVGSNELVISLEILNLFDNKNSTIINPVTGRAYEYGDPTPASWNDPLYPELQAPIDPFPFNPARYLPPRNIRVGISWKF